MWLLSVTKSDKPEKKLKATFCKCEKKNECKGSNHKVVHFGQKGSSTYPDHKDDEKKKIISQGIKRTNRGTNQLHQVRYQGGYFGIRKVYQRVSRILKNALNYNNINLKTFLKTKRV